MVPIEGLLQLLAEHQALHQVALLRFEFIPEQLFQQLDSNVLVLESVRVPRTGTDHSGCCYQPIEASRGRDVDHVAISGGSAAHQLADGGVVCSGLLPLLPLPVRLFRAACRGSE